MQEQCPQYGSVAIPGDLQFIYLHNLNFELGIYNLDNGTPVEVEPNGVKSIWLNGQAATFNNMSNVIFVLSTSPPEGSAPISA